MSGISTSQQEFLNKLSDILEANLEREQFGVSELARELGMSRSSLHRKIREIFNISVSQYIRQKRLEKGHDLLQNTSNTVSEVAFKVGFSSVSYFITCYREHFGYTPGDKEYHEIESEDDIAEEVDIINNTQAKRFKIGKLDRSDLIVWAIVFIFLANIIFINFGPKPNIKKHRGIRLGIIQIPFSSDTADSSNLDIFEYELQKSLMEIPEINFVPISNPESYIKTTANTTDKIGKDYDLTHLIYYTGLTINGKYNIKIDLTDVKNSHSIWVELFESDINSDLQDLIRNIAFQMADTLEIPISKSEMDKINKKSTENLLAFNQFSAGLTALNQERPNDAQDFFLNAIELDSTYADPYVQLAHLYLNIWATTFNYNPRRVELIRDTALRFVNLAIKYDSENYWAYFMRADIYKYKGEIEKYREDMNVYERLKEKAGIIDVELPNRKFWNSVKQWEMCEAIENYFEYLNWENKDSSKHGNITKSFTDCLIETGFPDIAYKYIKTSFTDSIANRLFRERVLWKDYVKGDYKQVLKNAEDWMNLFGTHESAYPMWKMNMAVLLNDMEKAKDYLPDYLAFRKTLTMDSTIYEVFTGIYYYKTGDIKNAKIFFDRDIQNFNESLYSSQIHDQRKIMNAIWLAAIYAIKGENKNCFEALNFLAQKDKFDKEHLNYLDCYFFDSVREEPQFKKIYNHVNRVYQEMHDCVRRVLIENGEIN